MDFYFSDYLMKQESKGLQKGVKEKLDELQDTGMLETTILLSGQMMLTEHYLNWNRTNK